ncbi:hypothetical protein [Dialister invisus]|uniref:hypothetical protein n=1 Tax=Dialister invisus TaxID=218538 RepID=UPI00351FCDBB
MPIPFIIAGLAVVAGGLGVAGALDAKEKMDEAKEVGEEGEEIVKNAKARCERKKNSTKSGGGNVREDKAGNIIRQYECLCG